MNIFQIHILFNVFGYWRIIRLIALFCGLAILEVSGVLSILPFLTVLTNPELIQDHWFLQFLWDFLIPIHSKDLGLFLALLGGGSFVFILMSAIFRGYSQYKWNNVVEDFRDFLSQRLVSSYLSNEYKFFLLNHSSDLAKTALSEVDEVTDKVVRPVLLMIVHFIVLVAMLGLIFALDPMTAISIFTCFAFFYLSVYGFLKNKFQRVGKSLAEANSDRFKVSTEAFGSSKLVKIFNLEQFFERRFKEPSSRFARAHAVHSTLGILPTYGVEVLLFGGVICYVCFVLLFRGGTTEIASALPALGVYAFSAYRIKPLFQILYHGTSALRFGNSMISRIVKDISAVKTEDDCRYIEEYAEQDPSGHDSNRRIAVRFFGVGFRYENSNRDALKEICCEFFQGERVGVVGLTGAGKSTLLDLVLGLVSPSEGTIEIFGESVSSKSRFKFGKVIGYVPQDITLFDMSVADNIAIGSAGRRQDRELIQKVAKLSQVDEFVSGLPEGYESLVGEAGVFLSGGQRQRVGIARALYLKPRILVLDEATSALDSITERVVMDNIKNLNPQMTVICVTHRAETLNYCDRVFELSKGRMFERVD